MAGYFIHFSLATYGAILLNYFGFGKGWINDLFKIMPDKKAAIQHLGIPKDHLLEWYD